MSPPAARQLMREGAPWPYQSQTTSGYPDGFLGKFCDVDVYVVGGDTP